MISFTVCSTISRHAREAINSAIRPRTDRRRLRRGSSNHRSFGRVPTLIFKRIITDDGARAALFAAT